MYASIRHYKVKSGSSAEIARKVNSGFLPIISKAAGFVAYYLTDAGHDVNVSVSVFQSQAGAEESNRLAADWVKQNLAALVEGAPAITAGEVVVHQGAYDELHMDTISDIDETRSARTT